MVDTDQYTVGWISETTLGYMAARSLLDEEHDLIDNVELSTNLDITCGKIRNCNIVIACASSGDVDMATPLDIAKKLHRNFGKMEFILDVGIAGGAPSTSHDIRLGDVVVGYQAGHQQGCLVEAYIRYDMISSKRRTPRKPGQAAQTHETEHYTYRTPRLKELPLSLRLAVKALNAAHYMYRDGNKLQQSIKSVLDRFPGLKRRCEKPPATDDILFHSEIHHDECRGYMNSTKSSHECISDSDALISRTQRDGENTNPDIHHGMIRFSRDTNQSSWIRDKVSSSRQILCFVTGSVDLMTEYPSLVIRGIKDYSDSHPRRMWHGYATLSAAVYAKELLYFLSESQSELERSGTTLPETTGGVSTGISRLVPGFYDS